VQRTGGVFARLAAADGLADPVDLAYPSALKKTVRRQVAERVMPWAIARAVLLLGTALVQPIVDQVAAAQPPKTSRHRFPGDQWF